MTNSAKLPAGMNRRSFIGACLAGAATSAPFARSMAAEPAFPSRSVSITVPYAPGGQGDVFARLLSEPLGAALGQTVVVENRPGASGMLGTRQVIREKPDGHHLLMGQTGEISIMPIANAAAGYDPLSDLEPVVLVGDSPLVLIAPKNAPYNALAELLEMAKREPDTLAYASSGTATPGHLAAAALCLGTNTKMIHVPYKGAGQAMTDLIGGQVHCFFSSASAAMGHVRSGAVKVLAVSTQKRLHTLPGTPTVAEAALPGFTFSLWGGVFAPKGTDQAAIARLNKEINAILTSDLLRKRFVDDGSAVEPNSPAEFRKFLESDIEKYKQLVAAAGVRVE